MPKPQRSRMDIRSRNEGPIHVEWMNCAMSVVLALYIAEENDSASDVKL
jgi:hypothetical protein